MPARWLVYAVLTAAIVSLLLLFWQSLVQVRQTQQHVTQATLATAWPLYQANGEIERFRTALARHVANDPAVTYDDVLLRFDILQSRVPLLDTEVTLQIRWRGLTPKGLKVRAQVAMAKLDTLLAARDEARDALDLVVDVEAILLPLNRALTGLLVDFQNEQNRLYASTKRSLADLVRHRNALIVAVFGLTLLLLCLSFMDMRRARRAEARFKAFAGSGSDWLWETDQRGKLTFASPGWEKTFDDPPAGNGRSSTGRIDAAMAEKAELRALVARRAPFRDVRCEIATALGEIRTVELAGVPVHGRHGRFEGYRGVATDISEKLGQERRIQYLAEHDALTALRNRAALLARLDALLDGAGATPPPIVLLALDLDGFKAINDALGHDVGDQLLAAVASRLAGAARQGDVIARFGGDEFAILQHGGSATEASAVATAARIIDRLSRPFAIDGQLIQVGVSIGIAVCPDHDAAGAGLIKAADLALYRAKQDGRNCYRVYSATMGEQLRRRRRIEVALRDALRNEELELHYQPLVRLATRRSSRSRP
jgi:diguanylate cyclase (GGDEF)-like protein